MISMINEHKLCRKLATTFDEIEFFRSSCDRVHAGLPSQHPWVFFRFNAETFQRRSKVSCLLADPHGGILGGADQSILSYNGRSSLAYVGSEHSTTTTTGGTISSSMNSSNTAATPPVPGTKGVARQITKKPQEHGLATIAVEAGISRPSSRRWAGGPRLVFERGSAFVSVSLSVFILIFGALLLAPSCQAKGQQPASQFAPVEVDGNVLFRVSGAMAAELRAQAIADNIEAAAADETISTGTIQVTDSEGGSIIKAGDRVLVVVTEADANMEIDRRILAWLIRDRIAEAIETYRHRRSPAGMFSTIVYAVLYALGATAAVMIVLIVLLRRILLGGVLDTKRKTDDLAVVRIGGGESRRTMPWHE